MTRIMLRAAVVTVILSAWMLPSAEAQVWRFRRNRNSQPEAAGYAAVRKPAAPRGFEKSAVVHVNYTGRAPAPLPGQVAARSIRTAAQPHPAVPGSTNPNQPAPASQYPGYGYPYLNAPMYVCPLPNIPYQVGGAVYTNQAFAPHEMLHEHEYEALYAPFYYKVKGHWFVSPWGVWSSDEWKLVGTKVEVEYEPHLSWFSGFVPPRVH